MDECAVFGRETSDLREELVAYIVSTSIWNPSRLDSYLRGALPDLVLPVTFIRVSSIPLTSHGEVKPDTYWRKWA